MRYSSSMLAAVAISFLVFLGMSFLVTSPKFKKTTQIEMVNFSKVADMKEPNVKPNTPKEPPKRVTIKQPPVSTPIDVTSNSTQRPDIEMPKPGIKSNNFDLTAINIPNLPIGPNGNLGSKDGNLIQLLPVNPMYPPEALRKKLEGWVKVEFIVNELGKVSSIDIIDAQPRRVFENATKRALLKSKFKPLIIDGKAVPQKAIQTIEFKLD